MYIPTRRSIIKELRDYNTFFFQKKTTVITPTCSSQIKKNLKKHITRQRIGEKVNEINNISKSHELNIERKKKFQSSRLRHDKHNDRSRRKISGK